MTVRRRRDKRIWYVIVVIFVAVGFFNFLRLHEDDAEVEAASLEKFDAGYIISDYQMGNYESMTEAEIQEFLTSKNSCANTDEVLYNSLTEKYSRIHWHFEDGHFVCLSEEVFGDGVEYGEDLVAVDDAVDAQKVEVKNATKEEVSSETKVEVGVRGETAAHIIWQAAQDYKINPQVLIVLLEKEQGLITDPYPHSGQYQAATGYGCPDTAACSSKYYGFKNQIRNAAAMFRVVLNGGWTNFPLGKNYIQYNPSPSCGGSVVEVKNLATSALYRYTPYQPNVAALAAGYGTAECGAYGNRNFYLYFQDWFGGITNEAPKKSATVETKKETKSSKDAEKEADKKTTDAKSDEKTTETTVGTKSVADTKAEVKGVNTKTGEYSGTYTLISALDDDMVLDISGGAEGAKDGTNIQLWERNGTKAQEWEFSYNSDDDTYTLVNPYTKKVLDVKSASTKNGANIQLLAVKDNCGQKWKVKKDGNYYLFVSACSEKVLDVKNAGIANGTNIQLWEVNGNMAQKWKMEKLGGLEGIYTIVSSLDNNKVLDVAGGAEGAKNGTNIQLWEKNGTKAQEWQLIYNKDDGSYTLINPYTKKALDVSCAGTTNGTNIQLWETHETCAQRWKIKAVGGYYVFSSACSDEVLDVSAANTDNGTNIQLWEPNGTKAQKWKLVKK